MKALKKNNLFTTIMQCIALGALGAMYGISLCVLAKY